MNFQNIVSSFVFDKNYKEMEMFNSKEIDHQDFLLFLNSHDKWIEGVCSQKKSTTFINNINVQQYNFYKDTMRDMGFNEHFFSLWREDLFELGINNNSSNLLDLVFTDPDSSHINPNDMIQYPLSKNSRDIWPLLLCLENHHMAAFFSLLKHGAKFTDDHKVLTEVNCSHPKHPYIDIFTPIACASFANSGKHWWNGFVLQPEQVQKYQSHKLTDEFLNTFINEHFEANATNETPFSSWKEILNSRTEFEQILIEQMLKINAESRFYHFEEKNNQPLPKYPSKEILLSYIFLESNMDSSYFADQLKEYGLQPNDAEKEAILTLLIRKGKKFAKLEDWDFSCHNGQAIDSLFKKILILDGNWNDAGKILTQQYKNYVNDTYSRDRSLCLEFLENATNYYHKIANNRMPKQTFSCFELLKMEKDMLDGVKSLSSIFPDFPIDKTFIATELREWFKDQIRQYCDPANSSLKADEKALYEKNCIHMELKIDEWLDNSEIVIKHKKRI